MIVKLFGVYYKKKIKLKNSARCELPIFLGPTVLFYAFIFTRLHFGQFRFGNLEIRKKGSGWTLPVRIEKGRTSEIKSDYVPSGVSKTDVYANRNSPVSGDRLTPTLNVAYDPIVLSNPYRRDTVSTAARYRGENRERP